MIRLRNGTFPVSAGGTVGQVVLTAGTASRHLASDGSAASGSVSVVRAHVRVGPETAPLASADFDLLPLTVEAHAPAGPLRCPSPWLDRPGDGSVIADATPTLVGRAAPDAATG